MPHQRGQAARGLFPAGYCHPPTTELPKTERDPISTSGPSMFSMSPKFSMLPNQAISSDKSIRFSPLAAARPQSIRSRPEVINASRSKRACRMAKRRNACSLLAVPDFSEFAQAVRYGVLGTPPSVALGSRAVADKSRLEVSQVVKALLCRRRAS